jgi:hypothetical protein
MWLKRQVSKVPPKRVPFHPTAHVTAQQQKTIAIHVNKTAPATATKPRTISLRGVGQFVQGVAAKGMSGADLASQLSAGAFGAAVEKSGTHHIGFGGGLTPSGVTSGASVPGAASFASDGGDAPTAYNAAGIPEAASNPADDWAAGGGGMPSTASGPDDLAPFEGATLAQDEPGVVETFLDHMTAPEGAPGPRTGAPGFSMGAKVAVGGGIAAGVVAIAKLLF